MPYVAYDGAAQYTAPAAVDYQAYVAPVATQAYTVAATDSDCTVDCQGAAAVPAYSAPAYSAPAVPAYSAPAATYQTPDINTESVDYAAPGYDGALPVEGQQGGAASAASASAASSGGSSASSASAAGAAPGL